METRCLNCMQVYDSAYDVCPHCGFVKGTPPKEANHLHPGMMLQERYIVGTVVSFGGFGVVYRAWDTRLETMVAIKEFFPTTVVTRTPGEKKIILLGKGNKAKQYRQTMDAFIEEARTTAKFEKHPNIVNVFNYFEENGTAYFVMEYMDGISLKGYLKQNGGSLDVDTTIEILLSVINALKAVHKEGILHRDIAPDNIFLCKGNKVKLFDFGAAKFSDEEMEKTREVVLKPGYAPPEQYQAKSVQGPWTDIYALGATMYRALTGVIPDESTNRVEEDTVKRPREMKPEIPEYIDAALMRAMSVTPEFRFKNVQEFEDAILNKKVMRTEAEQRKFLLRRRLIGVASVALAVLIGAFAVHRHYEQMAELEECEIIVWMPAEEADLETAKTTMEEMKEEFESVYNEEEELIHITVEYIPEEEYGSRLTDALVNDEKNAPTVFDGSYLTKDTMKYATSLKDVVGSINKSEYYFLNAYKKYFPEQKQLPLGYTIPVNYVNYTLLLNSENPITNNSIDRFIDRTSLFCVAGTDSYRRVQDEMGAGYMVVPLREENAVQGRFVSLWSVNGNQDDVQVKAGKRLLYYFLGQRAQDALCVQNAKAFPLNKEIMETVYVIVNPEMSFVPEQKTDFSLNEADWQEYYDALYMKELEDSTETVEKFNNFKDGLSEEEEE